LIRTGKKKDQKSPKDRGWPTELGLDAEGLIETVLHLNLGFFCMFVYFIFCFLPFDEKMTELLLRLRSLQDWRLKD
jgi:hypothetical protein